jgi:hypothetical protein
MVFLLSTLKDICSVTLNLMGRSSNGLFKNAKRSAGRYDNFTRRFVMFISARRHAVRQAAFARNFTLRDNPRPLPDRLALSPTDALSRCWTIL